LVVVFAARSTPGGDSVPPLVVLSKLFDWRNALERQMASENPTWGETDRRRSIVETRRCGLAAHCSETSSP
jgi:hypothetical protein